MRSFSRSGFLASFGSLLAIVFVSAVPARAQGVADFYRGKTITFLVGAAAAGAYDVASRALANHMPRHSPGAPNMVVQNMPGAASLTMTNFLFNRAPRDGTTIGMPNNSIPLEPRLQVLSREGGAAQFNLEQFNWVGTPTQDPQALFVWHSTPARNIAAAKSEKILLGSTATGADNFTLPTIVNKTLGTKFEIVTGYQGQSDIFLAIERGEMQGNSTSWSNIVVGKPDWVKEGKARVLLQFGARRLPGLPDAPTAIEAAGDDVTRAMFQFYSLKFQIARPVLLPPGVPAERVRALQAAFDATMKDPLFLAEAEKLGLDIAPLGGDEIRGLIAKMEATPRDITDRLRQMLQP